MSLISARWVSIFQSTLSVRRATNLLRKNFDGTRFQSTLSVRRATRPPTMSDTNCIFQSTLSVRRATHADWQGMAPF